MKTAIIILVALAVVIVACKGKVTNSETGNTFKDVDVMEAQKMIESNSDLIILDVRTPAETAEGMLPGAIEIDFQGSSFDSEIAKLDKTKPYLVYCRSGVRSVNASNAMIASGFTDVTNMKGGYTAWPK